MFDTYMQANEHSKTISNHCAFVKKFSWGDFVILLLYIDDMLIVANDATNWETQKRG